MMEAGKEKAEKKDSQVLVKAAVRFICKLLKIKE